MLLWQPLKNYSTSERNGIFILILLLIATTLVRLAIYFYEPSVPNYLADPQFQQELEAFYADTLVELNTANIWQLSNLPGIGKAYAENIIAYRDSVGGINNIDELLLIKGIGPAKLEKIKPYVYLNSDNLQ